MRTAPGSGFSCLHFLQNGLEIPASAGGLLAPGDHTHLELLDVSPQDAWLSSGAREASTEQAHSSGRGSVLPQDSGQWSHPEVHLLPEGQPLGTRASEEEKTAGCLKALCSAG